MARKTPARSCAAPPPPIAQTPLASQAEQDLAASEQRFRLLVESVTDYAIYMLDPNGVVTNWNSGAQRFKGYSAQEIVGKNFSQFFTPEDRQAGLPEHILETAVREGRFEDEGVRVRKDGTHFWASVVVDTIRDETGKLLGFAKITRDISERRRNEERLWHLAHYDALTDLPNRLTLCERLREALSSVAPLTLLMLDLDGFKEVNDTLGHAAGDAILKAAAERIKSSIGKGGIVGRLGGDEFAVVLPGRGDPTAVPEFCNRLLQAFRMSFPWQEQDTYLGLSIGVAIAPSHGDTPEELLGNADLALYRAKAEQSRDYCLYQPGFRRAVVASQSELFYQPQVSLADYRVTGVEALLRWHHPRHGLIAPGAFIHVLERGPLASTVGEWVIRQGVAQAAKIRSLGFAAFRVSVNLFDSQLRKDGLTSIVTTALEEHALPPDALALEITENIFLQRDEVMIRPLRRLRQLGVGVAFDDYGTGYASLSLLKGFPLSRLKIDQSFVRDLCTNSEDAAVVRTIIYLAHSFGLDVTAEGIEREEQRMRLRELSCESGQGYVFGRPVPAARMLEPLAGGLHDGTARWSKAAIGLPLSLRA
jgi:diguanylate cyclase (GGDEF)-like protein/PAS domain S-box-containing protein